MPLLLNKVFLLCRCTRRDYAEDMFYNGNLYFNYPINWIKMGDSGDEGQGDLYEGVYANIVNEKTKQLRSDSEIVTIKNKLYLRSRSVNSNWPCLSFYCISELTEGKKENESIVYDMAKDYIESFSHDETFQSMLEKPLQDRMSMVIIMQTGAFFRKLREFLITMGWLNSKIILCRRFRIETKIQSLYTKTDLTSCLTKRAFLKNSKSSESF